MDSNTINGILRAIVPAMVAWLVGKGYIANDTAGDITASIVAIGSAIWSVISNRK